jgi:hypothetical protein
VYAFQLALALVIAYGLALSFDWERPRWTAFAVVDRTLETGLGIVVYTSVALLVWRQPTPPKPPPSLVGPWFFPDRDAVIAALRVFFIYWLAFLAIIYIPDFPTGLAFSPPWVLSPWPLPQHPSYPSGPYICLWRWGC